MGSSFNDGVILCAQSDCLSRSSMSPPSGGTGMKEKRRSGKQDLDSGDGEREVILG
jgi:hypothetical protein